MDKIPKGKFMNVYHDINLNKGNGAARSFLVRGLITVVALA
jgi:hypothetical protein